MEVNHHNVSHEDAERSASFVVSMPSPFSRQVPFRATRDECLVLQQALNLVSQIRLLGASP